MKFLLREVSDVGVVGIEVSEVGVVVVDVEVIKFRFPLIGEGDSIKRRPKTQLYKKEASYAHV